MYFVFEFKIVHVCVLFCSFKGSAHMSPIVLFSAIAQGCPTGSRGELMRPAKQS